MKKYKARISNRFSMEAKIEEVEIERETESSVWINGRRNAKVSMYECYFDSFSDAKQAMLNSQNQILSSAKMRLAVAEKALQLIMAIEPE